MTLQELGLDLHMLKVESRHIPVLYYMETSSPFHEYASQMLQAALSSGNKADSLYEYVEDKQISDAAYKQFRYRSDDVLLAKVRQKEYHHIFAIGGGKRSTMLSVVIALAMDMPPYKQREMWELCKGYNIHDQFRQVMDEVKSLASVGGGDSSGSRSGRRGGNGRADDDNEDWWSSQSWVEASAPARPTRSGPPPPHLAHGVQVHIIGGGTTPVVNLEKSSPFEEYASYCLQTITDASKKADSLFKYVEDRKLLAECQELGYSYDEISLVELCGCDLEGANGIRAVGVAGKRSAMLALTLAVLFRGLVKLKKFVLEFGIYGSEIVTQAWDVFGVAYSDDVVAEDGVGNGANAGNYGYSHGHVGGSSISWKQQGWDDSGNVWKYWEEKSGNDGSQRRERSRPERMLTPSRSPERGLPHTKQKDGLPGRTLVSPATSVHSIASTGRGSQAGTATAAANGGPKEPLKRVRRTSPSTADAAPSKQALAQVTKRSRSRSPGPKQAQRTSAASRLRSPPPSVAAGYFASRPAPMPLLRKAFEAVKVEWAQSPHWQQAGELLRTIRQDLFAQQIRTDFAVDVCEFNASAALASGDTFQFEQASADLEDLYSDVKLQSTGHPQIFLVCRFLYLELAGGPGGVLQANAFLRRHERILREALDSSTTCPEAQSAWRLRGLLARGAIPRALKVLEEVPKDSPLRALLSRTVELSRLRQLEKLCSSCRSGITRGTVMSVLGSSPGGADTPYEGLPLIFLARDELVVDAAATSKSAEQARTERRAELFTGQACLQRRPQA